MRIDLGFSVIGGNGKPDEHYLYLTRRDVIKKINAHPSIDNWVKTKLVEKVKSYPDSALVYFVSNINKLISAIVAQKRKINEKKGKNVSKNKKTENNSPTSRSRINEIEIGESSQENINEESREVDNRESLFARRSSSVDS